MPSKTSTVCPDQSLEDLRRELTEAREQQAATAAILATISNSPTDPHRVFAEIAASAARLCDAYDGTIHQLIAGDLRLVAHHGPIAASGPIGMATLPLTRTVVGGRAVLERQIIQIPDLQDMSDEYPEGSARARRLGHRTILAVPLLRAGEAIGVISLRRTDVRPFSERQIRLLKTFADQAVIAIDNARLFGEVQARTHELTESLEYQTATSEVLSVISTSPGELVSVFQAMLANATRLCDAKFGTLNLYDGETYRNVALHNVPTGLAETRLRESFRPHPKSGMAHVARTKEIAHTNDLRTQPPYLEGDPAVVDIADLAGARTIINVPMLKDGKLVGTISILRQEVRPLSDKQIALVKGFASQAVIAIENARLLNELHDSLAQQKATGEVLAAISGSITDAKPVFDTIVRNMLHLFGTQRGVVQILKNGMIHLAAAADDQEFDTHAAIYPQPLDENTGGGRAMLSKQVVQFAPVLDNPSVPPVPQNIARSLGFNSMIMAPMIRGDTVIGAIGTSRKEPNCFDDKQIALIKTFADQAVIAVENARLFEEVQERTRELSKTVEDLEVAGQHKNQFVANMSHELRTPLAAILGFAELIQEGFYGPLPDRSMDALTRIRSNGKHLLGLINSVLDIAKIESGQFSLNLAEIRP